MITCNSSSMDRLASFTDVLGDANADEITDSQPISLSSTPDLSEVQFMPESKPLENDSATVRPQKRTGQHGDFRSVEEIDSKFREIFTYPYFNIVQSRVIEDAIYSDKSMVVCAPTGSGKTVVFEMAIVQLLMELEDKKYNGDFKIIYMAPVKALCTERLSEWYPKFTKLGLMCIEVTGDTDVDFSQLKPYRIIITTPEKWDMLTRRWRDHRSLVEVIKLFLIDEVHILNDDTRGPVLEAVVSRMKTIESSSQAAHRIEQLQKQYQDTAGLQNSGPQIQSFQATSPPHIRFVAVSATISNPDDVAAWLGTREKPAVFYKFGDECRPVKLKRVVEGYPCAEGMSIFKFDIILNYKLWPIIQKHHNGKPTLIFCNTRKSVALTADMLARELTISFTPEQKAKLTAVASTIKNKKFQALVLNGVGCHHAGLLYEERLNIEKAFRNRDLPILITTTTLAMGVNLPAHLVIIKNTQQYVNGAYQEYSISTILQMVGRAGRPQFDTEATAVIMTRLQDKPRYQALVGGSEPLQSYLHKRLAENLNSEAALGTVCDVAQCVEWLRSTFLSVRAAKEPRRYLGLPENAPASLISKKIEELCVKAMNGLASSGLITMDEASCIESTEAGRLMSIYYLDLETMKHIMKIEGNESLEGLLWILCESHELADMHLRVDERRTLNTLNRNNAAATIRYPMKGKISTRQMKLNCIIQAVLGCLSIPDPSLNQEAMKVIRIAQRVCKCLVAYVTRPDLLVTQPQYYSAVLNSIILAKCVQAHLWENSPYVSKQLKGIGPTFSALLVSAGKVNFTLLEESHPRDLERIMNKGAPAGNVLRKQVSLLPRYQLTATPIDANKVAITLLLLNQNYLSENRDQLTAGDSHKCYVVAGDSENYLLLFASFKDKDLISVFDGTLFYEVTRKHSFEHKIFIHCVSSNWVGIDAQCDFVFKSLEPLYLQGERLPRTSIPDTQPKKSSKKQTCITDVYKERKRKNSDLDISQSKEKKKRDNALIEKFKHLKNSFEVTSMELKESLSKTANTTDKIINEIIQPGTYSMPHSTENTLDLAADTSELINNQVCINDFDYPPIDLEDLDEGEDLMVNERINNILNEIENEICEGRNHSNTGPKPAGTDTLLKNKQNLNKYQKDNIPVTNSFITPSDSKNTNAKSGSKRQLKKTTDSRNYKACQSKSNFSFIDSVNLNQNLKEDDPVLEKENGFSDTIKKKIELFLQSTSKNANGCKVSIDDLINYKDSSEHDLDQKIDKINKTKEFKIPSSLELPIVSLNSKKNSQKCFNNRQIDKNGDRGLIKINNAAKSENIIISRKQNTDTLESHQNYVSKKEDKDSLCVNEHDSTFLKSHREDAFYECDNELEYNLLSTINDCAEIGNDIVTKNEIQNCRAIEYTNIEKEEIPKIYKKNEENDSIEKEANLAIPNKNTQENNNNDMAFTKSLVPITHNTAQRPSKSINKNLQDDKIKHVEALPYFNIYRDNASVLPIKTMAGKNSNNTYDYVSPTIITSVASIENVCKATPSSYFTPAGNVTQLLKTQQRTISNINNYRINNDNVYIRDPKTIVFANNLPAEHSYFYTDTNLVDKAVPKLNRDTVRIENTQNEDMNNNQTTNEALCKRKEVEYINRHLFTATKVNVYTKNTPEHKVQIIRKLKLDLDVTEIISKSDNIDGNTNGMFHDSVNKLNKETQNLTVQQPIITNKKNRLTGLRSQDTKKILRKPNNSQDIEKGDDISKKEIDCPTEKKYCINNDSSTNTGSNNIENILQKYSSILRKNDNISMQSLEHDNSSQKICKPTTDKIKRLYKINDIHNLDIPLPKNLIAVAANRTYNNTEPNSDTLTSIKKYNQFEKHSKVPETCITKKGQLYTEDLANNIDINLQEITPITSIINPAVKVIQSEGSCDASQLESSEDFNIDQSMFNPKTLLLQCFSKENSDDEIILPPTEFCDRENIYSPTQFHDDLNDDEPNFCIDEPHQGDVNHLSIFKDNGQSVLAPSEELETWNLTTDDLSNSFPLCHSDTWHHLNRPVVSQSSVFNDNQDSNSRPAKLGKFKFMHKNKLNLK